jgi:APA family basic amino acid/polyamine antiporter
MSETLKRQVGLLGAVAIITGLIVGGSMYVIVPQLARATGPSVWLAYAVAAIPAIFAILYTVQLGGALPTTGGHYVLLTRLLSPVIGWICSLGGALAIIASNCFVAYGFAKYLYIYVPLGSLDPGSGTLIYAIVIVLLLGLLNWIGIRFATWVQGLLMLFFVIGMLVFSIGGLLNMNPANLTPLFPNGIDPFIEAVVIASFAWIGYMGLIEIGGEIKNPRRTIPKALVISFFIVLALYVLVPLGLVSVMNWQEITKGMENTAVYYAAGKFLPPWGVFVFIFVAAVGAFLTTINANIMIGARDICIWGRDGLVPTLFSRINKKFATPEIALLTVVVLSLIGIGVQATLDKYALIVVMFLMLVMLLASTATWMMPSKAPDIYKRVVFKFPSFWRWFTWIGCLICFGGTILFGFLIDLTSKQNPGGVSIVFVGIILLAVIYWYSRRAYLKRKGIDLAKLQRELTGATLAEFEEKE